jgi:hypothetical protein
MSRRSSAARIGAQTTTGGVVVELLIAGLRQVENEPGLLGVSAHLLTVARCAV